MNAVIMHWNAGRRAVVVERTFFNRHSDKLRGAAP